MCALLDEINGTFPLEFCFIYLHSMPCNSMAYPHLLLTTTLGLRGQHTMSVHSREAYQERAAKVRKPSSRHK
jgi:hypothetical protein